LIGMEDPRETLGDLTNMIRAELGDNLLGLYLWGSLTTGDFHPGRSDLDLFAIVAADTTDTALDSLRAQHEKFETDRPEWRDRIEVAYVSRDVLETFAATPTGMIVRISPGEPLHRRDLESSLGWLIDWHGALNGETLVGPPPAEVGPQVNPDRFRDAVASHLTELRDTARGNSVAYVPAQQGYIVATVCRALYTLETGRQTSKAGAIEWAAQRDPGSADWLRSLYAAYRADVRGAYEQLIAFVDEATIRAST
jgi:predicted nucleotidyltransferase